MQTWTDCLKTNRYLVQLVIVLTAGGVYLSNLHPYYQFIENRKGIYLNDFILNALPAYDLSVPIFITIWVSLVVGVFLFANKPIVFLCFLTSYLILNLMRNTCILLLPLYAPSRLVELKDILTQTTYGKQIITRDLFFSGHTSAIVLVALYTRHPTMRRTLLAISFCTGCMLLIQHVHYTIDIVAAYFFAMVAHFVGKKITLQKV